MTLIRDNEYVRWYPLRWQPIQLKNLKPKWKPKLSKNKNFIAIYLHFPFCSAFCAFCPFLKEKFNHQDVIKWCKSVCTHIKLLSDKGFFENRKVKTVYWGGGTPSLAPPEIVRNVMESIRDSIDDSNLIEVSFEAIPKDTVDDYLIELCETAGVTRCSFGVQSFNKCILDKLGSKAKNETIEKIFRNIKHHSTISIDILYNCPSQTKQHLMDDIHKAIDYGVDQVSLYELCITPDQPLWKQASTSKHTSEKVFELFLSGAELLKKNELFPVLVSDFAKAGRHSIYQVEHWSSPQLEVVGLGPGAISYFCGYQYVNLATVADYEMSIQNGRLPVLYGSPVTDEEELCRNLVLGFKGLEVDTEPLARAFGDLIKPHLPILQKIVEQELVNRDGEKYSLTDKGIWFVDNISKGFYSANMKSSTTPLEDDLLCWTSEWAKKYA